MDALNGCFSRDYDGQDRGLLANSAVAQTCIGLEAAQKIEAENRCGGYSLPNIWRMSSAMYLIYEHKTRSVEQHGHQAEVMSFACRRCLDSHVLVKQLLREFRTVLDQF